MPFDGTQLNEAAAHLLRAKRYIEEHGWRQKGYGTRGGPRCILGALMLGKKQLSSSSCYTFLQKATEAPWPHLWNDSPGRTVEEVYAAFDRAIALAMEAGD